MNEKPKPLDLEDSEKIIELVKRWNSWWNTDSVRQVINITLKEIKQRIKQACEFYLRYKDRPDLFRKEWNEYFYEKVRGDYNEWLFKLAFKSVLGGERK